MILVYIDLEQDYISIQNDEIQQSMHLDSQIENTTAWVGLDNDKKIQLASFSLKGVSLSQLQFVLTDAKGTVYTSTMVGKFLPVEMNLEKKDLIPTCKKHGGQGLKKEEFCTQCFIEKGEKKYARRSTYKTGLQ